MTATDPNAWLQQTGLSGVFVGDSPTSRLAQEVYDKLAPYAEVDEANGWALRSLVEAVTKMYLDVDDLVRESPADDPGWSALFDAARMPPEAMPWLAQLIGMVVVRSDPLDVTRDKLTYAETGIQRGSVPSMLRSIKRTLTGNKTVFITERTTDAWHLSIRTRTAETPSSTVTAQAIIAQKSAGLVIDYATFTGILFTESLANQATYTLSTAAKATYTLRGA